MWGFTTCTLCYIYTYNDQFKNEMSRACSMNGIDEECIRDFGGNAKRKETTMKT
jgi:hypothetical protein